MKKFFLFNMFIFTLYVYSDDIPITVTPNDMNRNDSSNHMVTKSGSNYAILPEIKISGFLPTSTSYQQIYSVAPLYTVETSVKIAGGLAPFANVSFLYNSGYLLATNGAAHFTEIYVIPIGFGLKYYFNVNQLQPYLGMGMQVTYNYFSTHYPHKPSQDKWAIGGLFKLGTLANINSSVFLDFFVDYSYLKVNFNKASEFTTTKPADLSGFSLGSGLGMRF